MRTKWLCLLVMGLIAGWLSPCFGQFDEVPTLQPAAVYESAVQKIKVGETTEDEVRALLGNPQNSKPAGQETTFCFGMLPKAADGVQKYALEITLSSGKVSKVNANIPK